MLGLKLNHVSERGPMSITGITRHWRICLSATDGNIAWWERWYIIGNVSTRDYIKMVAIKLNSLENRRSVQIRMWWAFYYWIQVVPDTFIRVSVNQITCKFWWNFEFDWNPVSGTGIRTRCKSLCLLINIDIIRLMPQNERKISVMQRYQSSAVE